MSQSDKSRFQTPTEILTGGDANDWLQRGMKIAEQADSLQQHWQRAAGELADHSRLIHIESDADSSKKAHTPADGQVKIAVVFADSAAWASRIRSIATRLTNQLNQSLQSLQNESDDGQVESKVESIRVRIKPVEDKFGERCEEP